MANQRSLAMFSRLCLKFHAQLVARCAWKKNICIKLKLFGPGEGVLDHPGSLLQVVGAKAASRVQRFVAAVQAESGR